MRSFVVFSFLLAVTLCSAHVRPMYPDPQPLQNQNDVGIENLSVSIQRFVQKLDHLDPTNTQTWLQRYYVNDQYFNQDNRSLVFILISGQYEAALNWMYSGAWLEYARELGALAIQVEHRFYGSSQPVQYLTVENLKYLTAEQALEDLAAIMESLNSTFKHPAQYVVFGGGYAGSLATWLRSKYPQLVSGAVSSGGAVLAKSEYDEYYQVVAEDFKTVSQECYNTIQSGFAQFNEALRSTGGRYRLTSLFRTCNPLTDFKDNIDDFVEGIIGQYAYVALYHNIIPSFNLSDVCEIITQSEDKTDLERIADFTISYLRTVRGTCTSASYYSRVWYYSRTQADGSDGTRASLFQLCNEFGWFKAPEKSDLFGNRTLFDHGIQTCQDVFGSEFTQEKIESNVVETNNKYGQYNNNVSNVAYVNGNMDPWYPLSITKSDNTQVTAIFINGTSHTADMYPSSAKDSPQLTQARQQIKNLIKEWVN